MSMVTTCPSCTTTFRVTPPQLQASNGRVRCGRCAGVFDAFKSLATLPDRTIPDEPFEPRPPEPMPEEPALPGFERIDASPESPAGASSPVQVAETVAPLPLAEAPGPAAQPAAAAPAAVVAGTAGAEAGEPKAVPRRRRGWWFAAAALMLLALAAQAIYAFRAEIGAEVPAVRPALIRACAAIGCTVGYPRRPEQLSIEGSDLSVPDANRPNVIQLTATLRNRAAIALAHPSLELTLTNARDQTVARRVFGPDEYLGRRTPADASIGPGAEIQVKLDIDTGDIRAAGYRLYLFYP